MTTNEEAIEFFKDMNECTYGNVEPINMAIKALEQIDKIKEIIAIDTVVWEDVLKYKMICEVVL